VIYTLKPLLANFKVGFTSIGRVQTSVLYLLYLREKEIIARQEEMRKIVRGWTGNLG